ncbi:MAG: hypothetical protein HYY06_14415 [Deltaproteobacteria bacterium]|nr:hypothetical protein [Deltaproteobacteria bacterium]
MRIVLASAVMATLAGAFAAPPPAVRGDEKAALAAALGPRGLAARPADVAFLTRPNAGLERRLAFVLARRRSEPRDLYLVEARVAPTGRVLSIGDVTNVSRSIGADETSLTVRFPFAAYATLTDAGVVAVTLLDTTGEDPELTRDWSGLWKLANRITSYQDTGLFRGMRRRRYELASPAGSARLALRAGKLHADLARGARIVIDPRRDAPTHGAELATLRREVKAQPGLIGWAVDTVRAISWVGPEPIEWLEHTAFGFLDAGKQAYYSVAPTESAAELQHELGVDAAGTALTSAPNPELGWPPANLRPILRDHVDGEGVWVAVAGGPFTAQNPGAPPAFYTTFLRPDADRAYTRLFLTVWDPRQVELDVRAGTREPEDETGVAGDGQIPRDRDVLLRFAAGFNGGFQALHGEYGMGQNDRVLLPPKPWSATVARLRGGRIAFGTWPSTSPTGGQGVGVPVPHEVESYRQNMTVLVQDGVVDPYRRPWWGTAPEGSSEPAYTVRTGLCLTEQKFVVYFWGLSLSHLALAEAMRAAHCSYGVHLDMNAGHSGFEYYRVTEAGRQPPLEHPLERNQEAEGEVPGVDGLFFRARRMVRGMGHMNFPRYIRRDPRDFMYLLLKPILPGENLPALPSARPGEGEWIVEGLPNDGFPWAFARTFVRPDPSDPSTVVRVAKVDPRRVRLAPPDAGGGSLGALVPPAPPATSSPLGLELMDDRFVIAPGGSPAATGVPLRGAGASCQAAVGVDSNGILVYVEGAPPESLARALALAHAEPGMALCGPEPRFEFHFGEGRVGRLDERAPSPTPSHAVRFYGWDPPAAERLFPDVPIVPPMIWFPQQKVRIRYFHELQPINPAGAPRPLSTQAP